MITLNSGNLRMLRNAIDFRIQYLEHLAAKSPRQAERHKRGIKVWEELRTKLEKALHEQFQATRVKVEG